MNTIDQQQNKAYFMLPGFYEHFNLYKIINNFLKKYPEAKYEQAEIYCYYGNFHFCVWDGGRIFNDYVPATIEKMEEIKNFYNNILKSKIRFVFTNNLLNEKHLYDRYNNLILEKFNNGINEIVLNSEILEEYIKKHYSNYKLISSTTKCSKQNQTKDDLNNDNYIFTCLDYNLNHNWNFLNSLNDIEKKKTEFLVNPICKPGCAERKEHYRLNSLFSLSYGKKYNLKHCNITENSTCPIFNTAHITPEEIYNKYLKENFNYFKIEGRTWPSQELAIVISDYLIKPEFQSFFLKYVITRL